MKEIIINLFYAIGASPLAKALSSRIHRDVQLIMYHRVLPKQDYLTEGAGISTSVELFESHLKLIKEQYTAIPLEKIADRAFLKACPKPPVVLTFDDGYRDNYTVALPLLEKYQIPATFYITTNMLDGKISMWWYELNEVLASQTSLAFNWNDQPYNFSLKNPHQKKKAYDKIRELFIASRPEQHEAILETLRGSHSTYRQPETLTWQDLREMAQNPLVTIGAHTVSHPILAHLSEEEVRQECLDSKLRLEAELGKPIMHFAYPFGSQKESTTREYNILRGMDFKTAVTTLSAPINLDKLDYFAIPRISIKRRTTAKHLSVKLSGWNYLWNGIQI